MTSLVSRPDGTTAIARPRTFLSLVVDASISMASIKKRTLAAINEFLDTHRRERIDELFVTFTTFDTKALVHCRNVPIEEMPVVTERWYAPGGCTALYDGVGKALADIDKAVGQGDRVLVVVITDGDDNSSVEFDLSKLLRFKQAYEARGNWTFVYLGGVSLDAATEQGRSMGFADGNISNYDNIKAAMVKVDASVRAYRQSDDLNTKDFYTPTRKWKAPQWASEPNVVITDE